MNSNSTPDFDSVLDWLEGRLPVGQAEQVEKAVATGSPSLQRTVAWLRAWLAVSQQVNFSTSPALRARLEHLFDARMQQRRELSILRRYIATLTADSGLRPGLVPGIRGATGTASRQLLYSTEVAELVINLNAKGGKANLEGQVFSKTNAQTSGLIIQLLRDSVESAITATGDTGRFMFVDLSPGRYEIVAAADEFEIQTSAVLVDA